MTKRKLIWGVVVVLCLIALPGFYWTFFGKHEVSLHKDTLQSKIDAKLPFTTKNDVTVSSVKLDLSDDKIGLSIEATATKLKTTYAIKAETKGTLRYDHTRGEFYFYPETLKLVDVKANGASISEKVDKFIDKWVDAPKIVKNKAEIMAAAEEVVQGLVQTAAQKALERTPVYTLPNDFKGNVVHMLLKSVEVKNDHVIAHLSLWQFTKMVCLYIVMFLSAIAIAIFLITHPEAGLALIMLGSLSGDA